MFEDLIEYDDLLEAEPELFMFGSVTFKRDFGPWKQGDKVETLSFTTGKSPVVQEENKNGEVVKSCKFKLEAVV